MKRERRRRPAAPLVGAALLCALMVAWLVMPNASRAPATLIIEMSLPGASAREVESSLVLPVEERLRDSSETITSVSATAEDGSATVTLELAPRADPDQVMEDLHDVLNADPRLPALPVLRLRGAAGTVIDVIVSEAGDPGRVAHTDFVSLAASLADVIEARGVGAVVERATIPRSSHLVDFEPAALQRLGLTLPRIQRLLSDLPQVGVERLGDGRVRVSSPLGGTTARVGETVLAASTDGSPVLLNDVANVTPEAFGIRQRHNGRPAIIMEVSWPGRLDPAAAAHDVIAEGARGAPPGVTVYAVDR